ncbi:MAG: amino acid ABC transporter permease [Spirochaetaceae bacterium]|jgi:His/Glu/Gln/Arg/opine family amino acid ABC transporter permease subunit|nr:amino acid ABC transporter permease [Spirochaetaceae bacterium]
MNFLNVLQEVTPLLMRGMLITVETTILALIFAFILGLFICWMGISNRKTPRLIARIYIWIIRGTPLLVQTFFVYFGIPQLLQSLGLNFRLSSFTAGVITLSINAAAYIAEIFRGGIQAIDKGQMEAARSLGLSYPRAMLRIIIPQAFRISIPALVNQFIISLKDTSIISVISLAEIVYEAKIYIGRTMQSFTVWTIVGGFYLLIITLLSQLSRYIEKRLDYGSKGNS